MTDDVIAPEGPYLTCGICRSERPSNAFDADAIGRPICPVCGFLPVKSTVSVARPGPEMDRKGA